MFFRVSFSRYRSSICHLNNKIWLYIEIYFKFTYPLPILRNIYNYIYLLLQNYNCKILNWNLFALNYKSVAWQVERQLSFMLNSVYVFIFNQLFLIIKQVIFQHLKPWNCWLFLTWLLIKSCSQLKNGYNVHVCKLTYNWFLQLSLDNFRF